MKISMFLSVCILKIHEHKSMIKDNRANLDQILVKSMFPIMEASHRLLYVSFKSYSQHLDNIKRNFCSFITTFL